MEAKTASAFETYLFASAMIRFLNNIEQICSDFCSGYDYFGLEFGDEVSVSS